MTVCMTCGRTYLPGTQCPVCGWNQQAVDACRVETIPGPVVLPRADDTGFDAAPSRYMATGREAIDVIREELGDAGCRAFCLGNQRKYELRAGHKAGASADNDREKARWYRAFAAFIDGLGPDPRSYRRTS